MIQKKCSRAPGIPEKDQRKVLKRKLSNKQTKHADTCSPLRVIIIDEILKGNNIPSDSE